ncbi:MAG: GDSL-type esterase/lipase family protein [Verrucomicrobiales bacterium]|nr:GDSL-type esterase/lipase family protein [Verrucomicrobiales bacterium]
MKKLLAPTLLPLLLLSFHLGFSQDFSKWEKSIAAFETRDKEIKPPKDCLLFVGSSSIRMWDLEESWPGQPVVNNGFGGSTLADSIHFFDRIIAPYQPKAVIIYAGDNDIKKGLSAEETLKDFETLSGKIRETFPGAQVLYIAIKPSQSRWEIWPEMKKANDLIAQECAEEKKLTFVDIAAPMLKDAEGAPDAKWFVEDGLHLSKFGYQAWTAAVNEALPE